MVYPFVLNGRSLSVYLKGTLYSVDVEQPNFKEIVKGLKSGLPEDDLIEAINFKNELETKFNEISGVVFCRDGMIYLDGKPMARTLIERYKFMIENDFPIDGFEKFIFYLAENPSRDSREELYGFLEASSLPITEDGCFLAYKRVGKNYMDCHTGKIDNSVGKTVEMPREEVNTNRKETCSTGLHVCARSYLKEISGDHVMVCKINPRDVVSVPVDYGNAKMRVCRYEVVSELEDWDAIPDMAVNVKESVTPSEADERDGKPERKPKQGLGARSGRSLTKADKWDDYIKTRKIPEDLSGLHGKSRGAFIKFCARLRNSDGSEKAGDDICKAKTASEIRQIILGY